jgi:hypothetical protein
VVAGGNVYFAELSRVDHDGYELLDFTSSGLTHTNIAYARADNRYRVAGPYDDPNFGLIEIDWEAVPLPLIKLSAMGGAGEPVFEYTLPLSRLQHQ